MQVDSLSAEPGDSPLSATAPEDALLAIRGLTCTRNDVPILRDLAFTLAPGQILLIEGENGSGKTTLLRILCGLLEPDAGEILWRGDSIHADYSGYLRDLCYVGHGNGIKLGLTPLENLAFIRKLSAVDPYADLFGILNRFGLEKLIDMPAQYLSAGQRRRLALSRLLLEHKPLWILDEPFTSLDAGGRRLLRSLFNDHLSREGAVIMTSHDHFSWDEPSLRRLKLA